MSDSFVIIRPSPSGDRPLAEQHAVAGLDVETGAPSCLTAGTLPRNMRSSASPSNLTSSGALSRSLVKRLSAPRRRDR
jgi:hypothetical protein